MWEKKWGCEKKWECEKKMGMWEKNGDVRYRGGPGLKKWGSKIKKGKLKRK